MDDSKELNRLNKARALIKNKLDCSGRNGIYDLTGLSGGFEISKNYLNLLETYVGPAIFSEKINELGVKHLSGHEGAHGAACFNRTSSAILSTIMTLSKSFKNVVHFVPERPSHPSIPKSCNIFGMKYFESDLKDEIISKIDNETVTVITGATMDHKITSRDIAEDLINIAKNKGSITFFDDASGARLRKLHNEPPALEMGADLVVTSMDKLMKGPRAGLLAGNKELVDKIYSEGLKFGLEAQSPIMAAVIKAIEDFDIEELKRAFKRAEHIDLNVFNKEGVSYQKTPTGFLIKGISEEQAITSAMNLLENFGIITIAAAGMPGASKTLRIDFCSKDADKISDEYIINAILASNPLKK
ncbi:L-seryl-tRNA selenium transferase [Methanococcus vannielii SB]|jgi:L-seryl-tRNA(Ser) seleniumtransferase|uniref:L-seryl-tRNA selenium transferase n=1 Tax=Methanococcus vannielii (strain ATCC 35089 / DSM 1224 / JCM 13029 / OCM 148 / SB) TaxID=406327 RepID=A6URJ5_METVS|nr:TIGR03576 family pyridoxal phosphate-dependent enzyme [Methanococcus vannielii]ABR55117.1 L-seryl-tRNA selenium transferase [Methanococcus vannielii SB]